MNLKAAIIRWICRFRQVLFGFMPALVAMMRLHFSWLPVSLDLMMCDVMHRAPDSSSTRHRNRIKTTVKMLKITSVFSEEFVLSLTLGPVVQKQELFYHYYFFKLASQWVPLSRRRRPQCRERTASVASGRVDLSLLTSVSLGEQSRWRERDALPVFAFARFVQ